MPRGVVRRHSITPSHTPPMPLTIHLRHLDEEPVTLRGELPAAELDLEDYDAQIHAPFPLQHDLEAQLMDDGILVRGRLHLQLQCECARCLKAFPLVIDLPDWAALLPLHGEEAVLVRDDCVDLTPLIREDILLTFPQRPLCEPECAGLPIPQSGGANKPSGASQSETSSAWAQLNKLKLKD